MMSWQMRWSSIVHIIGVRLIMCATPLPPIHASIHAPERRRPSADTHTHDRHHNRLPDVTELQVSARTGVAFPPRLQTSQSSPDVTELQVSARTGVAPLSA